MNTKLIAEILNYGWWFIKWLTSPLWIWFVLACILFQAYKQGTFTITISKEN